MDETLAEGSSSCAQKIIFSNTPGRVSLSIGALEGPLIGCMHVRGVHKTQHAKHEAKFASFDSVDVRFNESCLFFSSGRSATRYG